MSARVRPWLLFGGIGMVLGFVLGIITANLEHVDAEPSTPPKAPFAARAQRDPPPADDPPDTSVHIINTAGRPAIGSDSAPVTIVEFTDYECPYCRKHFKNTLPLILAQYGGRVRYIVMNLPLSRIHPDAFAAAEAAECAADQHRFWEYHDRLFLVSTLDRATLGAVAASAQLDAATFARCVDTQATAQRVLDHAALARSLAVDGTPSFLVNGRVFHGAYPFEDFKSIIDEALESVDH